ncbi:hypothetical protein EYF80_053416 [Liparis tanakae]|uniref:Uncharacterized protein n=1 Tax=Liparis tanakae TaxID=230148 RepID=A0A4Z2F5A4_9TELE|nr:hypothetical protein EYF80_053416 [Liparis tanakae]
MESARGPGPGGGSLALKGLRGALGMNGEESGGDRGKYLSQYLLWGLHVWRDDRLIGVTLPNAPALELKKPLKRLAARFFQLSAPMPGSEPPVDTRASGVGIFVSPRNSVMFFLRRA